MNGRKQKIIQIKMPLGIIQPLGNASFTTFLDPSPPL